MEPEMKTLIVGGGIAGAVCAMRDLAPCMVFSHFDRSALNRQLGWLFDHHIAWDG
jgi:hypothetical protein